MKKIVFAHGWGLDSSFWSDLLSHFKNYDSYFLDSNYFENSFTKLDLGSEEVIGIGHSLGLIKLQQTNLKFSKLFGIQSFINFLGKELNLHTQRRRELAILIQGFKKDPVTVLKNFYNLAGVANCPNLKTLNTERLLADLYILQEVEEELKEIPYYIFASKDDLVVSKELVLDNFANQPNVNLKFYNKAQHALPCLSPALLAKDILKLI